MALNGYMKDEELKRIIARANSGKPSPRQKLARSTIQKNYFQRKLAKARAENDYKLYKWRKREARREALNNSAPIVQNSFLLKWLICIILFMVILSYNATGEITIQSNIYSKVHETTEINYSQEYKTLFYNETTAFDKVLTMSEAVQAFGRDNTWIEIINSIANVESFSTALEAIGTVILAPTNILIDVACLFINMFNSWVGNRLITPVHFKFTSVTKTWIETTNLWAYNWIWGIN